MEKANPHPECTLCKDLFEQDQIVAMVRGGMRQVEVAKRLGRTKRSIWRSIQRWKARHGE